MTAPSPVEVRLQRQAAAHASWANTPDRAARMAAAWAARDARFERLVDPDGVMEPPARAKAAASARRAHYTELSRRAAAARSRRAAANSPT